MRDTHFSGDVSVFQVVSSGGWSKQPRHRIKHATFETHMQKFVSQQGNGSCSKATFQNPQRSILEESIGFFGLPCAVPPSTAVETSWRIQMIALKRARVDRKEYVINKVNTICCSQRWMKRSAKCVIPICRAMFRFVKLFHQAVGTSNRDIA